MAPEVCAGVECCCDGRTCAQAAGPSSGPSSGVTEGRSGRNVPGKPLRNVSGAAAVPGPGSVGSRLRPKLRMDYLVKGYVDPFYVSVYHSCIGSLSIQRLIRR
eukprot:2334657-Prymnesium_polylepis.1